MRYPNREELLRMGIAVFAVYLGIYYWSSISHLLKLLALAFSPILMGGVIAYVGNIPMRFLEERLSWMSRHPVLTHLRRPLSLVAGFAAMLLMVAFLVRFIAPELVQSVRMMSQKVPVAIRAVRELFRSAGLEPLVSEELGALSDWESIQKQLSDYLMSGAGGGVMGSLVKGVSSIMSSTLSIFLSLILAIYLLMDKEHMGAQVSTLVRTYFGDEVHEHFVYVCKVVDQSFHSFIVGRCLVSLLLGVLCTGGMLLFGFPYAITIGTVVGVTYIVPVVGACLGAIIGALLIFSISPLDALLFVLYVLVLEQIEANVIFPQVVGSSTGLPGIWVLGAIAVGGELGGIPFILLSVPVAASIYRLVGDDMRRRGEGQASMAEPGVDEPAATEPDAAEPGAAEPEAVESDAETLA